MVIIVGGGIFIINNPKRYMVTFEGLAISTVQVEKGNAVGKPSDPDKDGYLFLGWYNRETGLMFNFNTAIEKDLDLYAKWEELEKGTVVYTIYFKIDNYIETAKVKENNYVIRPEPPKKTGYVFKYWAYENEEFDFSERVISDLTLVAVFENATPVMGPSTTTTTTKTSTTNKLITTKKTTTTKKKNAATTNTTTKPVVKSYIVNYDCGGLCRGLPNSQIKLANQNLTLSTVVPSRNNIVNLIYCDGVSDNLDGNLEFLGWSILPVNEAVYTSDLAYPAINYLNGDVYTKDENITLYAVFARLQLKDHDNEWYRSDGTLVKTSNDLYAGETLYECMP